MKLSLRLKAALVGRSARDVYARPELEHPHAILNPEGKEIPVSRRTIKTLDTMRMLVWDRAEKKHRIRPEMAALLRQLIRQPHFTPRPLRATDYARHGPRPGLPPNPLLLELGPDLSGAATVTCGCRQCTRLHEDRDRTPLPWDVANRVHVQGAA